MGQGQEELNRLVGTGTEVVVMVVFELDIKFTAKVQSLEDKPSAKGIGRELTLYDSENNYYIYSCFIKIKAGIDGTCATFLLFVTLL